MIRRPPRSTLFPYHDALPICLIIPPTRLTPDLERIVLANVRTPAMRRGDLAAQRAAVERGARSRSEEHTSELQSQSNLVCRLLLEKKKKKTKHRHSILRERDT